MQIEKFKGETGIATTKPASSSSYLLRFKTLFNQNSKSQKQKSVAKDQRFGRTVGVVWEYKSHTSGTPVACIVQIERGDGHARMTVYDGNDLKGTSVTNYIEYIATGVYLEHLASKYAPAQVAVFHRDTIPLDGEPQWGTKAVDLAWNEDEKHFENPSWNTWQPDFEIPELEKMFIRELRDTAAVAIEAWMRERRDRREITPREHELYDRYQQQISAQSEHQRYNLRGGQIFTPPTNYI